MSILGDVVYAIALGFWVLQKTGSTALMGTLMAVSVLPRILVSPIAGVVVDRTERRWLMILVDVLRGAAVVLVAVAAFTGVLQVWMVFAAGVILGLGGAFFTPAVSAVIPDITAKEKVVQANSVFSMLQSGGNIVGNSAGGVLFQTFGAPVLFLFNGISYLFSAACLLFARFPKVQRAAEQKRFFTDLAEGFSFVWRIRGLRALIMTAAVVNFFANMGFTLFLPFFQRATALGPARYGIAMALFTAGMFIGMALTAAVKVPPARRFAIFVMCAVVSMICLAAFPFAQTFFVSLALLAVAGLTNAIINVFLMAVMQLTVPPSMRGKVFSLMGMLLSALTPIAYALAGVLAVFMPVPLLMSACFVGSLVFCFPIALMRSFQRFINFDPERDTVESVA